MTPTATMDRDAVYALFASESDRDSQRRIESVGTLLALIPICAIGWARAITALIDLLGVL